MNNGLLRTFQAKRHRTGSYLGYSINWIIFNSRRNSCMCLQMLSVSMSKSRSGPITGGGAEGQLWRGIKRALPISPITLCQLRRIEGTNHNGE